MWTASQLSRHCAHHRILSAQNPKPTRDKAAAKGTAFHQALHEWNSSGFIPDPADDEVRGWVGIMLDNGWGWPDGCELEVAWGLDTWGKFCAVEEKPPGSHIYVPLDGLSDLLTAGRADACWLAGDVLVVVDWKTGRFPAELARTNLQVNAAGIALSQRFKARAYQPGIYYAREGRWDMGDEVELGSGADTSIGSDISDAAVLDDKPHPGPHCSDCWERKNCEAA